MFIKTFPVGTFQCNCSILADEKTGDAIVVDPGDDAARILTELKTQGFTVRYLVHTHAHIDHIAATRAVHAAAGGEVCLNKGDQMLYDNIAMQGEFLGLAVDPVVTPVTRYIEHQDVIETSGLKLNVLHTPGHTPGSVCFYCETLAANGASLKFMFSGDTLFSGSIGRTDLWGGDYDQIIASLKERVIKVPLETAVIPGHGPSTTIARELKSNPFLV
jgi:glyoxylase-like metal-dependent hydrolase (beta-lactamase superfamily II)